MTIDPKRVKEIFLEAAELSDEAGRAAYLDKACGVDTGVRERVEALLRSHDPEGSFLGTPAAVVPEPDGGATQAVTGIPVPSGAAVQTTDGENGSSHDEALTFLDPPSRPDALGRLGHYEVLQVLGRGGFGIVFRAFDEMLQRVVALKVMAPQLAATSPARKRFLREARSSAQVRHENVVQVYEVAEQPLPYLVMEFIPGETLQEKLNRLGPLEVPEVLHIGRQIAEGLAAAHAMDLIHRDIKPGNVLLEGGQHKVKITDFGLARAADDASISQSGIIAGTPMYMAPEQAQGQTLDQRADLFSLGSVIYQMVAGRPPFRANSAVAVLKRVAEDRPRAIREIIPETPQWLCDIIAKLHAKDPDDRYQSAREVADVLADCEAQLKANARLKDYSRIPRSTPQRSGRRRWVSAAIALLLPVMGLAVTEFAGVTHLLHNQQRSQQPPLPLADADTLPVQDISGHWVGKSTQAPNDSWFFSCEMTLKQAGKNVTGTRRIAPINNPNVFGLIEIKGTTDGHTIQFEDVKILKSTIGGGQRWLLGRQNLKITKAKVLRLDGVWQAEGVSGRNTLERVDPKKLDDGAPTKYGDPEYTNTLGMKFKLIPAGKFTMGSSQEEIDRCLKQPGPYKGNLPTEGPEHPVEITRPFYLGATEVTVGQFRQFVDEEGYQVGDARWRNPGFDQRDQQPVVFVSWNNAVDFCKWLSKKEGKEYRLPTEAEWEYSCRAGKTGSRYGFGDDDAQLENYAWFKQNSRGGTHPVDKKKPNAWGLYDMHGNAAEWCQDHYDPDYYKSSPVKDPPGGARRDAGGARAVRSGAWTSGPVLCRSAFRGYLGPDDHRDNVGFRVLLVSPPGGIRTESGAKDKPAAPAIAPFTDADVRRIAALPAALQVEEVRKELIRRNPRFAGKVEHWIENGVVTKFKIVTDQVTDIAPIRVFSALQWLACSGTATHQKANGQLEDLAPLRGMNLAALTHLWLSNTQVGDAGLAIFKDCTNLQELNLWNTKVTDAGLFHFKDCKGLTALNLGATQVSDAGLVHFHDCKALTHLWLGETQVGDAGLANFADCKNLTVLWIQDTQIGDASLVQFQDCKALTNLNLAGTKVSDVGLAHLKDCKDLYNLALDRTRVGDAGLVNLKGIPVKWLWIHNTAITDLTPLQGMPLEHMSLTPKNITRGLDILRDMKSLKTIGLRVNQRWPAAEFWERYDKGEFGRAFTDADVKRIAALPAAEQIEAVRKELKRRNPGFDGKMETKIEDGVVTECKIVTDQVTDIAPIRVFNSLRVLDLGGTRTNYHPNGQLADLSPLQGMNLTELTKLNLSWTKVGDVGLVHFKDCTNLTYLGLVATRVSDSGLAYFKSCKSLTALRLSFIPASDVGLAYFKDCKDLTELHLAGTQLSDVGLAYFKDCKNLILLDLNSTKVSDAGLVHFKGCTTLENLSLPHTAVTDVGLAHFKDCKQLTLLYIRFTKISDLSLLKGMPLKVIDCDFRPERDAEILRSIKTLKRINGKPAAEFWQRYDKGELKE